MRIPVLVLHILWMTLQLLAILVVVFVVKFALYIAFHAYFTELRFFIAPENHPFLSRVSDLLLTALLFWLGSWRLDLLVGTAATVILVIIGLIQFNRRHNSSLM